LDAIDETYFAESPCFEERLDTQRRVALLRAGLAQLDVDKRTTLDLFYIQERPVSEIARLQKKSVSAVKMGLLRARRLLADILRDLSAGKRGRSGPPSQ
jgi:RNA polymerase sigma-70 factor (ECF subfamily)